MRIETTRLLLEPVSDADDPTKLLPVFNTNPDFIEASAQFTGKTQYDLSDVEMYLWQGIEGEGSRCLAIRRREDGRLVGTASLLAPNPRDGVPWIGLLVVSGDAQGGGLGTEAARAIETALAEEGWPEVRLAVLRARPAIRAWWERRGYAFLDERLDQDKRPVWVLSKRLSGIMPWGA